MRATYEDEEQELESVRDNPPYRPDRELTLSSSTLLGIFFGLVLLCGLFFALGYTLGRRTPSESGLSQGAVTGEAIPPAPSGSGARLKPSAAQSSVQPNPQAPVSPLSLPSAPDSAAPTETASVEPALPPQAPPLKSSPTPEVKSALPTLKLASVERPVEHAAPDAAPATTLVQIAAVSNPADADVLIRALRQRGYSVNVRREPADALIHVQVGPFSTRTEASAMRQKLLSDGYNAILK